MALFGSRPAGAVSLAELASSGGCGPDAPMGAVHPMARAALIGHAVRATVHVLVEPLVAGGVTFDTTAERLGFIVLADQRVVPWCAGRTAVTVEAPYRWIGSRLAALLAPMAAGSTTGECGLCRSTGFLAEVLMTACWAVHHRHAASGTAWCGALLAGTGFTPLGLLPWTRSAAPSDVALTPLATCPALRRALSGGAGPPPGHR